MEWRDEGYVLGARRHGEGGIVLSLLTREHGRHAGLVKGGGGRRAAGTYEPGNRIGAHWRARLSEHLGNFTCELLAQTAAEFLDDPMRLAILTAAAAVAEEALPEREPHPRAFDGFASLIEGLREPGETLASVQRYVLWELDLLAELGFGLDLARCAVSGKTADLAFVSPNSGRAVSLDAAGPYKERLLPLPGFFRGEAADMPSIRQGLALTGSFLERHAFQRMPAARLRLLARLERA
jgi:DNA repair protein RecO (recombination protein O)